MAPNLILQDDLSGAATRALIEFHLRQAHANSPPGCVFALDLSGLKAPDVTVWTVRDGEDVTAVGALRTLDLHHGELKSMRTHPDYLRRGIATRLLKFLIGTARARGWRRLSLETGSGPAFEPALALYRKHGFTDGEAFADYPRSEFNQFLHLAL